MKAQDGFVRGDIEDVDDTVFLGNLKVELNI